MTGPLEIIDGGAGSRPDDVAPAGPSKRRGGADPGDRLRASLEEIVDALGRVREPGTATPTRNGQETEVLLRRARTLAEELQQVVGELLGSPTDKVVVDRRRMQLRVPVIAALERAMTETRGALGDRPVSISCPDRLCVQTNPDRLHDLLCALLADASRRSGEIHVLVQRQRTELVFTLSGLDAAPTAGRELDRMQSLARALGGHVEVVGHLDAEAVLRVRLPQQRAQDARPWV